MSSRSSTFLSLLLRSTPFASKQASISFLDIKNIGLLLKAASHSEPCSFTLLMLILGILPTTKQRGRSQINMIQETPSMAFYLHSFIHSIRCQIIYIHHCVCIIICTYITQIRSPCYTEFRSVSSCHRSRRRRIIIISLARPI